MRKCIKGESRLNPSSATSTTTSAKVYQRGITIESQLPLVEGDAVVSVSKGNHD